LKEILAGIADLIYPPRCATCGMILEEAGPLPFCPPCEAGLHFIHSPLCPRCGIPFPAAEGEDHLCGECLSTRRPYALARAAGLYEGTLLAAIHRFKYRGQVGLGRILGSIMADCMSGTWEMSAFSLIIPVPLHGKRLRERGFNQAVILARAISRRYALPLDFLSLSRSLFTKPQVGLGREERTANVRGAFAVSRPERVKGERILLVDDVYTTGSTLNECSRMLLDAGADSVAVFTLARAVAGDQAPGKPNAAAPGGNLKQ
jgi:ComF family protein